MKVLVIDNYDSFTYNLVHYLQPCFRRVKVQRNDELREEDVQNSDAILISPGPGLPAEAGQLMSFLKRYATQKPMLGVCLGMQAMVEAFGGHLSNLPKVKHGKQEAACLLEKTTLFKDLPNEITVGRYHSWGVKPNDMPKDFLMTSTSYDGYVMGMRHQSLPLEGVQFHPESIMTEFGWEMIQNWRDSLHESR